MTLVFDGSCWGGVVFILLSVLRAWAMLAMGAAAVFVVTIGGREGEQRLANAAVVLKVKKGKILCASLHLSAPQLPS